MYQEVFDRHAELLKAIAHPRRLEIVQLLRDQELCVSDIYAMLDLPQANISQHLMVMREAGIVTSRRDGKLVWYGIATPKIWQACDLLREVLIDQAVHPELASHVALNMKDLVPLTHDPVCQMRVSPKTAGYHTHYNQQDYYFCASGCLKKFQEDPAAYV